MRPLRPTSHQPITEVVRPPAPSPPPPITLQTGLQRCRVRPAPPRPGTASVESVLVGTRTVADTLTVIMWSLQFYNDIM